jgi:hypothetical protein
MRKVRWASWMVGMAAALALGGVQPAAADVTTDQAAAIVIWPDIIVNDFDDTVVQLSNTSTDPVLVHCFYENANSHCTNTGQVCVDPEECFNPDTGVSGTCVPGWNETDFRIRLTPRQPLGWLASEGVAGFGDSFGKFKLDGVARTGIDGTSNVGSRIPPVPEIPFNGSLKCIAVDSDAGFPIDRNVLKGETTIEELIPGLSIDVAKDNAIGIQAMPGAVNDDNILVIGGPDAEYNGCPNVLILNHFFDFAANPAVPAPTSVETRLVLVPCTEDFLRQIPGSAVVQYLVYNEFEQRFSTSHPMQCKQDLYISEIDTTQRERSIFSAGVAGTLTGQTRLTSVSPGSGLLAVADEEHISPTSDHYADFNVHYQGDREESDIITLP